MNPVQVVHWELRVPVRYPVQPKALVCDLLFPSDPAIAEFSHVRMVLQPRVRGLRSNQYLRNQLRQRECEHPDSGSKLGRIFIGLGYVQCESSLHRVQYPGYNPGFGHNLESDLGPESDHDPESDHNPESYHDPESDHDLKYGDDHKPDHCPKSDYGPE